MTGACSQHSVDERTTFGFGPLLSAYGNELPCFSLVWPERFRAGSSHDRFPRNLLCLVHGEPRLTSLYGLFATKVVAMWQPRTPNGSILFRSTLRSALPNATAWHLLRCPNLALLPISQLFRPLCCSLRELRERAF